MEDSRRHDYIDRITHLFTHATTKEDITEYYDEYANIYEDDMVAINSKHDFLRVLIDKYCPNIKEYKAVLDVGCGTGLLGQKLNYMGFNYIAIDGVDPSAASLEVARSKGVYRDLICSYFSKQPLDIAPNSYDMIVTFGTFLKGHLPCDCLYEMIRLVRAGGIIIILTRASSFDGTTVPEYTRMPALIKILQDDEKVRKIAWESPVPYVEGIDGTLIVLKVL